MDSIYASPSVVSNKVIKKFLDTELSSKTEPRQVKTVNQVDQLTKISYILDKAVTKLSEKYIERYYEKKACQGRLS